MSRPSLAQLHNLATQLRIDSVRATSAAGSGHPTTCLSAADIVAALFFDGFESGGPWQWSVVVP